MAEYKLTYFNLKGVGECIRYMFAYADVKFEDRRIEISDWPGSLKANTPFGQLPVLDVGGKQISQSVAICRFLGKKFGMAVSDPVKEALLESVVDSMRDVQVKLSKEFVEKTPEAREAAQNAFNDTYSRIEKIAENGYLYGSEPTWYDVYFAGSMDSITFYKPTYLEPFPNLRKLCDNIRKKESLKKYLATRPEDAKHDDTKHRKAVV